MSAGESGRQGRTFGMYRETTSTSWFGRLRNALTGILAGLVLAVIAIGLLFWNEGRAIKTYRALVEGAGSIISVDNSKIDPANEGKLIHIAGDFKPNGAPQDATLGMSAEGAVRLLRNVEMYQWVEKSKSETKTKVGGGEETVTTYQYVKEWSEKHIDSSKFKVSEGHLNPPMPIESERFTVADGNLGAFVFTGDQFSFLGNNKQIVLTDADAQRIKDQMGTSKSAKIDQGRVFLGADPLSPWVGDLRITFASAALPQMSAAGAQRGNHLADYVASNGETIFLVDEGIKSAAQMFDDAQATNTVMTWVLRVVGLLAMFIGFKLVFRIFGVAGDVIPMIGDIVRFGTTLISLVLTALVGSLTIGIAWLWYRPLIGIAVLAVGFIIAGFFWYRGKQRVAQPAVARA
jgi:hypothetical protein